MEIFESMIITPNHSKALWLGIEKRDNFVHPAQGANKIKVIFGLSGQRKDKVLSE